MRAKVRGANVGGLNASVHLGRYAIFNTDRLSSIELGGRVTIGDYVKLHATEAGVVRIGAETSVGDYSTIRADRAEVSIGCNTLIGPCVQLISTNHRYRVRSALIRDQDIDVDKIGVSIGDDCWLGAGCVVLPGVRIGRGVVVGAHAVVTRSLDDYSVVVGSPARVVGQRE